MNRLWFNWRRILNGAIFFALFALYATSVASVRNPPPFVDYPDWVYQGVLFAHWIGHHNVPGYLLKSYPIPNSLTTVGIGLLASVFPWQAAAKLWICIYFLSCVGVGLWILRRYKSFSGSFLLVLPGTVFLNLAFWYGHLNFEFGLCLLVLLAATLFYDYHGSKSIAFLLVLMFFAHMEACACGMLLFLCYCFDRRKKEDLLQLLPDLVLTGWYGAGRYLSGDVDGKAAMPMQYHYASKNFIVFKIGSFFKTLGYVNVASSNGTSLTEHLMGKWIMLCLAVLSILMGLVFFIGLVWAAKRELRTTRSTRFLWLFVLIIFVIFMFLPQSMLGTADPGSRIMLCGIAVGMFLLADKKSRLFPFLAFCSIVFCVVNLWQFRVVEFSPHLADEVRDTPPGILKKYAHVEPSTRLNFYQSLQLGKWDQNIFPTALFRQTTKY